MGYGGTAHSTVSVDIVQADVDAIIDGLTGGDGRNLSDLNAHLAGMFDLLAGYSYSPLHNGTWAVDYLANIQSGTENAVDFLSGNYYGPLVDTAMASSVIADCLTGNETGPLHDGNMSVVDWLGNIEGQTEDVVGMLAGWYSSVLHNGWTSAVDYLEWIESNTTSTIVRLEWVDQGVADLVSMLSGWAPSVLNNGYSTILDYLEWINEEVMAGTGFLGGGNNGPLTDIADSLYDWYSGQHAAELLRNIWDDNGWYLYDGFSGQTAAELLRDIDSRINDIMDTLAQFTFDGNGRLLVTTD